MITVSGNTAKAFYAYRDTFYNRMGYLTTFANEIKITGDPFNDSGAIIEFKVPRKRMILYALIAIFLVSVLSFGFPDIGLLQQCIILVTLYFGIVISLNSQFYYLKTDLEQMEGNFKQQADS
jgi:hypothetical protein